MAVRIIHQPPVDTPQDRDYVRVQACTDPHDDTVTLVTIQRVTEKQRPAAPAESTAKVKTLVQRQPMATDIAVGLAKRYAERKNIPVVYTETDRPAGI
jgi:hypothetical protein